MHLDTSSIMLPLGAALTYIPLPAMNTTADIQNTHALNFSCDLPVHNNLLLWGQHLINPDQNETEVTMSEILRV